ncbi:MAG: 1-phosphofructokinase [Armatimonadota bacterium]
MILTVTLNSTVDKTCTVENFRIDRIHQARSVQIVPGGKGINFGRVYQKLGGKALLTGYVGGHNGDYIREGTRDESLVSDFIRVEGESRICTKIVDPIQKTQTEINEIGPQITEIDIERFKLKYESLVSGMDYVVLAGSIPPGVHASIYQELIDIATRYGVRSMLDTSGEPLSLGCKAKPYIVKPNIHELSDVIGKQLATVEEAADAASELNTEGIEIVIVTFGRDGAIVVTEGGRWRARPPSIQFVSAVGSGDSFGAAFLYALSEDKSIADALKLATGAGAANATTHGSGFCTREDILEYAEQSEILELADGLE